MTKQRRTEIFNLQLARKILSDYSDQLEQNDITKLNNIIGKRGCWNIKPIYKQGGEDLDGRNVCERGIVIFSRKLRNTLAFQFYQDIDMKNAGYTWLTIELKKNNIDCEWVKDYCENREFILSKYMKDKNCNRDTAKQSFTSRIFSGKDKELKELANIYKKEYSIYWDKLNNDKNYNPTGKFICYLYHKWEWETISKIMEYFEKKKVNCFADLHDGFYVNRTTPEQIINELLKEVYDKFGVTMEIKEMTDFLDIPKEYITNYKQAICKTDTEEYVAFREQFEEKYGVYKVLNQDRFLLETGDDDYYLRNSASLVSTYCDWKDTGTQLFNIWNEGGAGKRFIYNYVLDPEKRMVDRIDFYPNPERCPDNVYNLFTGFYITKIEDTFTEKDHKDFDLILGHLKVLVDDGEPYVDNCYNYLLDWCSQIFQEPDNKSLTMLIIKGGEGTGKSLLVQQLGYMMGEKYYLSTANAVNDLFGNFNSVSKNRLLINIDEVEASQTDKVYEQLKNLITRNKAHINEKFEKPMVINDYIRYFMTTNNEGVVKISDTNRRFVAFESIHAARKDIDEVKDAFFNEKALKLLYNFLMKRDISKRVWKDFPKTKYYKRCLDASISNTYKFLDNLFSSTMTFDTNHKTFTHKIKKSELRDHYEMWCMTNKISPLKLALFDCEIEATYLFIQRRTNSHKLWLFNIEDVITKLKKMGLYDKTMFLED